MTLKMLAIDPGLRGCGCAVFEGPVLRRAWFSKNTEMLERGPKAWRAMAEAVALGLNGEDFGPVELHTLAIEYPQVYKTAYQKGDQDDIVQLQGCAGAVVGLITAKHYLGFTPRYWKGQVPKLIHNERVAKKLSPEELANIYEHRTTIRHNVIDAIGIGIFVLETQGVRK